MGFWSWLTGRGPLVPDTAAVRVWDSSDKLDQSSNVMTGAISEAWQVWRQVGEIHYVTTQQARLASRLEWVLTVSGSEIEHEQADDILKAAFGNTLPDLVRRMALHIQVSGAFFLLRDARTQEWDVITWPAGYKVKAKLDQSDVIIEITNDDPADPKLTDSPVLAAIPVAREIILSRQQARVSARNRTAQLNTVLYPREGAGPDPDAFESKLTKVMVEPLADEMSASSVVPNVIGFQGDRIDQWRTIDLTGPIDEKLHERIQALIRQLAVILDIPPEIMTGLGGSDGANHWSAWSIQEDNWLGHVEPMAKLIGTALALALSRAADLEPDSIEVEPDPAPLLKRRPSLPDVINAFDRGLVSSEWTRRQLGAGEEDAPAPGEVRLLGNPAVGLPSIVNVPSGTVEALQTEQGAASPTGQQAPAAIESTATQEPVQPQAAAPSSLKEETVRRLRLVLPERAAPTDPEPPFSTDRLSGIDLQAFDAVEDMIDMVTVRVLERLGAQLRSSVSHDKQARAAIADTPNAELPIKLGVATLTNVDQTITDTSAGLLTDGLGRIVNRAYGYTRSAGIKIDLPTDTGQAAIDLLLAGFQTLITVRLQGAPTEAVAWRLSRRVIATAGGNPDPAPDTAAPGVAEDEETPLAGIALGLIALDFIRRVFTLQPAGYRWQHVTLTDPHPVHEELDGRRYPGGTIPTRTYNAYIGDHAGCRCQAVPLWRNSGTVDIIGEPPEGEEVS